MTSFCERLIDRPTPPEVSPTCAEEEGDKMD